MAPFGYWLDLEVLIEGRDDPKVINAVMQEVDTIVDAYGGLCAQCGPVPSNYAPFEWLFDNVLPAAPDENLPTKL